MFDYPAGQNAHVRSRREQPVPSHDDAAVLDRIWNSHREFRRGAEWNQMLSEAATFDGQALPLVQIDTLDSIAVLGSASIKELASALCIDPSTTSRIVTALIDAGLLTRAVDTGDRRLARVHLSDLGTRTREIIASRRRYMLAEKLAGMSPSDKATLAQLLDDVSDQIAGRTDAPPS